MVAMATNSNITVPQNYTTKYSNLVHGWDTSHPTTISKRFIILIYHYLHAVEVVVYQYDKPFGYGCWMTSITTMNHILIFLGYSEFPRWLPWQPIQILQYPKIIQQSIPI